MTKETFKVLEWLRKVRDEDAERFKDASSEEIIRVTRDRANSFLKRLEERKKETVQIQDNDG